ncbi:MAG TPA: glycosyltransferase family 2 protein [Fimbriimonadaceae bacterium]|nr:glycosyltransferase family 2 protein [Fimbriimonadaceae bacterium]
MVGTPESGQVRLGVVIVSYNTKDHLRACLESLGEADEIIVVDNASRDGSPEMVAADFPHIRLIANAKNRGFGAANNQGLDAMTSELALLLNSDAAATPGALGVLREVMSDPSVVACGGQLQFPDGRVQASCCAPLTLWAVACEQFLFEKLFPRSRFFSPYWLTHRLLAQGPVPHEVAQVMGACLCLRRVERFDERFFLYCEDTELCHRLQRHGRILYVPGAVFTHALGASSAGTRWQAVARYNRGKELYFKLHHGPLSAFECWSLNREGALLRLLGYLGLCLVRPRRAWPHVQMWAKVLCAPVKGPALPPDA